MLAPFWGDVDTRSGFGICYYEVLSNAMIFHWKDVGYYSQHGDKLNTFELIITDFTSPLLQPGTNVGFFYANMDWTTGDASSGTNGYGGTPATVGANKGDGISYIQIGLFDAPGNFYDGPLGNNDGVDWLDNKTFMFNVCNSTNLPPIVAGIDFCDTLKLCVGDTFPINVSFLAPESNQIIWASADTSQASGFNVTNIISGTASSAQIDGSFIGDTSNVGVNIVTFTAYDNGTPADTISFDYIIIVDTMPMIPVITGDTTYCQGNSVLLNAGAGFDTYLWSNGDTTQTSSVTQGSYTVQASIGGCSFTTPPYVVAEFALPTINITGDSIVCPGDTLLLNATSGYNTYLWNTSVNDTLDSLHVIQGVYTVTVSDSNNCSNTSAPFTVVDFSTTISITGDTTYCLGDSVLLDAGSGYDTYAWNTGDTTQLINVTQGIYYVTVSLNTCSALDSHVVNLINVPKPIISGNSSYCAGASVVLNADSSNTGYSSFSWNTLPVQTNQVIVTTQGSYTVSVMYNGCPSISDTFVVTENPLPTPLIIGNLHYCSKDSSGTTLSTNLVYANYNWSTGDTSATILASSNPSNYSVSVTDSNGCTGSSSSVTISSSAPNNILSGITDFCPNQTITISSINGFASYLWSNGDTTSSTQLGEGTYTITVSDTFGCTDKDTVTLTPNPFPVANFSVTPSNHAGTNDTVVFTDQSTIASGNIVNWDWDFDNTNIGGATPSFAFTQGPHIVVYTIQGTYTIQLIITSDKNCSDTTNINYLIIDDVFAPNVFTPNGDNYNETLFFKNLKYQPNNHLIIFDRWGKKIYEKDSYQNDWNGDKHAEGTYFYILTIDGFDPLKGSFTILR